MKLEKATMRLPSIISILVSFVVLILVLSATSFAEEQNQAVDSWYKEYKFFDSQNPDLNAQEILATEDGGYFIAGLNTYYEGVNYFFSAKLDSEGQHMWSKQIVIGPTFDEYGNPYDISNLDAIEVASGYILLGYSDLHQGSTLIKIGFSGNIIWSKDYTTIQQSHDIYLISSIAHVSANEFVVAGITTKDGNLIIQKLNVDGDIIWSRTYGSPSAIGHVNYGTNNEDIIVFSDGRIGVINTVYSPDLDINHTAIWIVITNQFGIVDESEFTWEKTIGLSNSQFRYPQTAITEDGGLIIGGTSTENTPLHSQAAPWVMKLSSIGHISWQYDYSYSNQYIYSSRYIDSIVESPNGYLIGGWGNDSKGFILSIDRHGNLQWEIGRDGNMSFADIHVLENGEFTALGRRFDGLNTFELGKFPSNGLMSECEILTNETRSMQLPTHAQVLYDRNISFQSPSINQMSETTFTLRSLPYEIITLCTQTTNCNSNDTAKSMQDSDEDGLLDVWEECGYDYNNDGIIDVDLPKMGADPTIKDIFIEVDYMVEPQYCLETLCVGGHSHKPNSESISKVVNAFARQGIHLHVDYGPDAPLTWGRNALWGEELSESDELPHTNQLNDADQSWEDYKNWPRFDLIKEQSFLSSRKAIFHFALFVHQLGGTFEDKDLPQATGISRNNLRGGIEEFQKGASDFIIALSNEQNTAAEGATFMHELGHNLGLLHGGKDNDEYKPNYFSVMNYSFSNGLIISQTEGHLDYSVFDSIPTLNEISLDEKVGIANDELDDYGTRWYCARFGNFPKTTRKANGAINWDCSILGINSENVQANINKSSRDDDELISYYDWDTDYLAFDGGAIGESNNIQGLEKTNDLIIAPDIFPTIPVSYSIEWNNDLEIVIDPNSSYLIPITLTNKGELTTTVTISTNELVSTYFDLSSLPTNATLNPSTSITYPVTITTPVATSGETYKLTIEANISDSPLMGDKLTINALNGIKAWYSVSSIEVEPSQTVTFTNLTVGDQSELIWDFGDGTSSSLENPTHQFDSSGIYTVTLTVSSSFTSDVFSKVLYVSTIPTNVSVNSLKTNATHSLVPKLFILVLMLSGLSLKFQSSQMTRKH